MTKRRIEPNDKTILQSIGEAVREVEPCATALLYGSRARGTAHAGSDWDVLVLLDGPVDQQRSRAVDRRLHALSIATGALLEAITLSWDEWDSPGWRVRPYHKNVDTDAIELTSNGHEAPPVTEEEMAEAREELIRTWLEQAQEELEDAEILAGRERWRSCVGRLYYAAFHTVSALLVSHGYNFSSHRGVESLFKMHFGNAGAVPTDLVSLYAELHKQRLLADYDGRAVFDEAQVRAWLAETERLLAAVEQLIETRPEA